jgi:Cellulose biosynthesis protein BcsS
MRFLRGQRLGSPTPFVLRQCALTALFAVSNVAALNAAEAAKDPEFGWREMWVGADASKNAWLIYTGVTLAPFSKDIYSDGLRLRLSSGYGKYNYRISRSPDRPKCPAGKDQIVKPCIDVDVGISYVDALVGYQMRFGELTAKAFAGISTVDHKASLKDADNLTLGRKFGGTGALELWLNLGENAWTSLDLSYTTAHETGAARWRAGWRVLPTLSIGPEARFDRNEQAGSARIGGFARYEWLGGEISAAVGVAQRYCDFENRDGCEPQSVSRKDLDKDSELEPYATINFLTQF